MRTEHPLRKVLALRRGAALRRRGGRDTVRRRLEDHAISHAEHRPGLLLLRVAVGSADVEAGLVALLALHLLALLLRACQQLLGVPVGALIGHVPIETEINPEIHPETEISPEIHPETEINPEIHPEVHAGQAETKPLCGHRRVWRRRRLGRQQRTPCQLLRGA
jgi:hypothetical protein